MKWKGILITMLAVLVLAIAGCGKKEVKPVAIDEKNDKCAVCHMAVANNQFASEVILENGKSVIFDDIGCMYKWISEHKNEKIQAKFVRDYNTKDWIEADKATYVYNKSIRTPMSYNVISFKNKKDAESFVSKNKGTVLTYKELQKHKWEMNKEMMMKHGKDMNMNMNMNHSH